MAISDPLGDMLTRIRNAQMRRKSKVSTPASKLREHVLDVLASEGYIRGYSAVEFDGGKAELEIELKYFDGEPVIRSIERISKPGGGCIPPSRISRGLPMAWACRSFRRRAVSWPTMMRGSKTLVARCFAASSDAAGHSRKVNWTGWSYVSNWQEASPRA